MRALVAGLLALGIAGSAMAQRPGRGMGNRPAQGGMQDPRRAQLEDDVRREFARAVRQRVGLNDEQMQKLGPLTRKYEEQRRQTQADERDARVKLQATVIIGLDADSARINQYVQQLLDVQKRRVAIAEAEQKELATIMTPLQRARYLGLQEQVRRRLEQMRPPFGESPGAFGPGRPDAFGGASSTDSAFVRFAVLPLHAEILVDSVSRGTGRTRIRLPLGSHRLTFTAPGCASVEAVIDVRLGPEATIQKTLTCK